MSIDTTILKDCEFPSSTLNSCKDFYSVLLFAFHLQESGCRLFTTSEDYSSLIHLRLSPWSRAIKIRFNYLLQSDPHLIFAEVFELESRMLSTDTISVSRTCANANGKAESCSSRVTVTKELDTIDTPTSSETLETLERRESTGVNLFYLGFFLGSFSDLEGGNRRITESVGGILFLDKILTSFSTLSHTISENFLFFEKTASSSFMF
ncbi:hypothetical protein L1887_27814 [Cichorium endivia]|nr:hypothetical protein L1887_27807 [Cichorium endivia]KAI3505665.1 hypothetical protein L1887_27814 [Cichorium endivia]